MKLARENLIFALVFSAVVVFMFFQLALEAALRGRKKRHAPALSYSDPDGLE